MRGPAIDVHRRSIMGHTRETLVAVFTVFFGFFVLAANGQCADGEFKCANTKCIPMSKTNNSVNDCEDNSDEAGHTCPQINRNYQWYYQFHCTTGDTPSCLILVPGVFPIRDGTVHCPDSIDERRVVGSYCENYSTVDCEKCNCQDWIIDSVCASDNVCKCPDGYYQNSLGTNCTKRILGDSCSTLIDCRAAIGDSQCLGSTCECNNGYMQNGTDYCQQRKLHDSCSVNNNCTATVENSQCLSSECECISGYEEKSPTACTKRKIDDSCSTQTDCSSAVDNSKCVSGVCTCSDAYNPSSNKETCELPKLGDTCSSQAECTAIDANANCTSGLCSCNLGYYNNGGACSTLHVKGGSCRSAEDCQAAINLTVCTNGACQCKLGYFFNGKECERHTLTTGTCTSSASCAAVLAKSECVAGQCQCKSGFKAAGDKQCIPLTLNDPCTTDPDCRNAVSNSLCLNETCHCDGDQGYEEFSTNICKKNVTTNDSLCTTAEECETDIAGSVCESNICACPGGTELSPDDAQCSPSDGCAESNFVCKMPWLIAVIIIGVLLILAHAGLLFFYLLALLQKKHESMPAPQGVGTPPSRRGENIDTNTLPNSCPPRNHASYQP